MNGLIGGILRGTGQTLQQIGTANQQLNIEEEKNKAEEARQMRVLEMRQKFETQTMERENELRQGGIVLEAQLRAEEGDKDRAAREKLLDKELSGKREIASMKTDDGSKASDKLIEIGSIEDPVTGEKRKQYARMVDGNLVPVQVGASAPAAAPATPAGRPSAAELARKARELMASKPEQSAAPRQAPVKKEEPKKEEPKKPMYRDGRGQVVNRNNPYKDGRGQ